MWGEFGESGWVWLLAAARVLPVAVFSPLCGGRSVPLGVRIGMGLVLTAALAMGLPAGVAAAPVWVLLAKELLIGAALALGVVLFFEAIAGVGAVIDAMAGRGSGRALNAAGGAGGLPVRGFSLLFAIALYFSLGGGRVVVRAFADSFAAAPVFAVLPEEVVRGLSGAAVMGLMAGYLRSVLLLAAPVAVVLWLTDLAIGAAARLLMPVSGFFAGLTVKPLLAVVLCGLVLLGVIEAAMPGLGLALSGVNGRLGTP